MRLRNSLSLLLIFAVSNISSQTSAPPKREFRGAWIATVTNLDWPSQRGLPAYQQKNELVTLLDKLKNAGINAVIFQIRPECDAFYQSTLEPWSYWLTGKQGQPPSPYYDPLQFAIEETHKRGMELHAWFNPYRAVRSVGSYQLDPNHVSVKHPDWILTFGTLKILDPGLPQVRDYVTSVIMDVVRRYDVDGVHFDDYFYPYPPNQITNEDDSTFAHYNRGFTDRGDWRRDNINLLIKQVHDSTNAIKPWVKFGISPFGIWKNGIPPGIIGLDAYNVLYADALAWLNAKTIDYIAPQLYWPNGGNQDYGKLMPWWAEQLNGRHLYVGQAAYRIPNWGPGEIEQQIRQNRANAKVGGSIFFRALNITGNDGNFADSLKLVYYRYPSLLPQMAWKDSIAPNPPQNLQYAQAGNAPPILRWDLPVPAIDGDTATRYVIYRFDHSNITPDELADARNIISVEGTRSTPPPTPPGKGPYSYIVTAVDRNYNESSSSNTVTISAPQPPLLAGPANGSENERDTVVLHWFSSYLTASYRVQVSQDSSFASNLLVDELAYRDTLKLITGMEGLQKYYWRVAANNAGGSGQFSDTWNYTTAFPRTPLLASPNNLSTEISIKPTFIWHPSAAALNYRLQVSRSIDFAAPILDTVLVADTTYKFTKDSLQVSTVYAWRVAAINAYGSSKWSEVWRFKTRSTTGVVETPPIAEGYHLYQNYPNPFNPTTTIEFSIGSQALVPPSAVKVSLRVYDVLGQEVAVLIDRELTPGFYTTQFNGSSLPSGVYIVRLIAGSYSESRKMLLIK